MTLTTDLTSISANRNAYLLGLIALDDDIIAAGESERNALAVDYPCCDSIGWMMLVGSECLISQQRLDAAYARVAKLRGQLCA